MLVVARVGELATGMSVQLIRMVLMLIRTGLDGTVRLHHAGAENRVRPPWCANDDWIDEMASRM